jgi:hypothetical protein
MSVPFERRGDEIRVSLAPHERAILESIPGQLDLIGEDDDDPAAARLDPDAIRDDPDAAARFRQLTGDDLSRARKADRSTVSRRAGANTLTIDEAESWMRVIGEARLAIAARIGIEDESWETDRALAESREGLTLQYLSYLQDALVQALSEGL